MMLHDGGIWNHLNTKCWEFHHFCFVSESSNVMPLRDRHRCFRVNRYVATPLQPVNHCACFVYRYMLKNPINRDGLANFFFKSANRKSAQFSGPIRTRKFLRYPSSQTSNPQIVIINRQIPNPQISTKSSQLCLKTVIKSSFYLIFYYIQIEVPQI